MKLKIHSIADKGELTKELLWIEVLEDVSDLTYYMVCDTTYTEEHSISNELRHVFWFPKKAVKKGDWIALRSTKGQETSLTNNSKTTTHTFYWGLGRTIWNKDGDCAVLFHLNTWKALRG